MGLCCQQGSERDCSDLELGFQKEAKADSFDKSSGVHPQQWAVVSLLSIEPKAGPNLLKQTDPVSSTPQTYSHPQPYHNSSFSISYCYSTTPAPVWVFTFVFDVWWFGRIGPTGTRWGRLQRLPLGACPAFSSGVACLACDEGTYDDGGACLSCTEAHGSKPKGSHFFGS